LRFGFLFEKADGTRRVPAKQARKINNQMGKKKKKKKWDDLFCWFKTPMFFVGLKWGERGEKK
jgi:hypothetical protein